MADAFHLVGDERTTGPISRSTRKRHDRRWTTTFTHRETWTFTSFRREPEEGDESSQRATQTNGEREGGNGCIQCWNGSRTSNGSVAVHRSHPATQAWPDAIERCATLTFQWFATLHESVEIATPKLRPEVQFASGHRQGRWCSTWDWLFHSCL